MNRTLLFALTAALLCSASSAEIWAADSPVSAHLRALDRGQRTAEMRVRLELNWQGGPQQHIVGVPRIEVPDGAALRPGLSRSSFDDESTRWSHDVVVTLPDTPGPWTIGPARTTLKTPGQKDREIEAAAIRTGRPSRVRQLAGQALGNGIVLVLALWFGITRYRRLRTEESSRETELSLLLEAARSAAPQRGGDASIESLLEALLALRLALGRQGVENGSLWTPAELRDRLDRAKFGGEEIPAGECLQMLRLLEAAIENGQLQQE